VGEPNEAVPRTRLHLIANARVRRGSATALTILGLLSVLACGRAVTWMSTERAPWSYVREAWGGIIVRTAEPSGTQLRLTFELDVKSAKRVDSGICVCGIQARLDGTQIVVGFSKCVCGSGTMEALAVAAPRPRPGAHTVVYDERTAGYPVIASIKVE
jgi:hypothetical protein